MADPAGRDLTARGAETRASEDNQFDRGSRFGPCGQPSALAPSPSPGEGVLFLPGFTSHLRKGICETELTSLGTKPRAVGRVRNGSEWVTRFSVLPDRASHRRCPSIPDTNQRTPQPAARPERSRAEASARRRRPRKVNPCDCPRAAITAAPLRRRCGGGTKGDVEWKRSTPRQP